MRIGVIVPTTAGPRAIVGIQPRPRLPASLVITADDYRPLDDITERYDAFVGPAGPLRRHLDLAAGSFELRLDAPIDCGRSWELPVALAHAALLRGAEIVTDAPDLVVWATGALDPDLAVKPDDYHLAEKFAFGTGTSGLAGDRFLVLLPGDGPAVDPFPEAAERHLVATFADAEAFLQAALVAAETTAGGPHDVPASRPATPATALAGSIDQRSNSTLAGSGAAPESRRSVALAITAALVIATLVAVLIWRFQPQPPVVAAGPTGPAVADANPRPTPSPSPGNPPADTPADAATSPPAAPATGNLPLPSGLVLVEQRDRTKGACIAFLMRDAPTRDDPHPVAEGLPAMAPAGLCALAWRLATDAEPVELRFEESLLALVMSSDRHAGARLEPGDNLTMRLVQTPGDDRSLVVGLRREGNALLVGIERKAE